MQKCRSGRFLPRGAHHPSVLQEVNQDVAAKVIVGSVEGPSTIDSGDLLDEGELGPLEIERKGIDSDSCFGAADYL